MERDRLDKMLDEWLDRTAPGFGKADARPGFEARIIATLHSKTARRMAWFRWQAWAAATCAVAVILLCVLLARFADHGRKRVASNISAGPGAGLQERSVRAAASTGNSEKPLLKRIVGRRNTAGIAGPQVIRRKGAPESLPRQEVFPSAGLSDQDRLLIAYVRAMPSSGDIAAIKEDSEYRPIEINRVKIPQNEISWLEIEPITIEALP